MQPQINLSADKKRILVYCQGKFLSEGFYKTSMDEVAKDLQISKKTIYKYFPSKENLIEEIAECISNSRSIKIQEIIDSKENVVTKFIGLLNYNCKEDTNTTDKWLQDLKRHTPRVWEKIDNFRSEKIILILSKLIKQGKKEKLIEDFPAEIIITSFLSTVRSVINPDFLQNSRLTFTDAFRYTFEMLLNGILTEEGKKKYYETKALLKASNKKNKSKNNLRK